MPECPARKGRRAIPERKVRKVRKAIPAPRGRREMTGHKALRDPLAATVQPARKGRKVPVPMDRKARKVCKARKVRKARRVK